MKSKRKRFEMIASKRVSNIINVLDSLCKCSNRNNYEYDEADIKKMEKALRDKLNEVMILFKTNLNKGSRMEFKF